MMAEVLETYGNDVALDLFDLSGPRGFDEVAEVLTFNALASERALGSMHPDFRFRDITYEIVGTRERPIARWRAH